MKERKLYSIIIFLLIMAFGAILFGILLNMIGLADNEKKIPNPTYTPPEEIIMSRGEAPAQNRPGLIANETFDEALERTIADVPDELAELAGRAIWGEAGGIPDEAQRAAVVWCACNRADAWGLSMDDVLVGSQFHGLLKRGTVPTEHIELARDVLARWALEHEGWQDVGRTIAPEYLYFYGNGRENIYTVKMHRGTPWDWSLTDPYNGETGAEESFDG